MSQSKKINLQPRCSFLSSLDEREWISKQKPVMRCILPPHDNGVLHVYRKTAHFEVQEDKLRPAHYKPFEVHETWNCIRAWNVNFMLGNALKYISRAGKKGDKIEDLRKAITYLEQEIKFLEKKEAEK